jgi:orotidine-5'-phosphate decarboxylase
MRTNAMRVAADSRQAVIVPVEERLIVALDLPDRDAAIRMVDMLGDNVRFYKIGLELQMAGGFAIAAELIKRGKKIFLDSKLFDIAETVKGAVANVANLGVDFLTVHGNGKIISAAMEGRGSNPLKILSVTVLTSLDAYDIQDLGYSCSINELVMLRVRKALDAGCDGVIASGQEAQEIRDFAGNRLIIVSPGIRSSNVPKNDQKRVASPTEAIAAGADYLVVGRQITTSAEPAREAARVLEEIDAALGA